MGWLGGEPNLPLAVLTGFCGKAGEAELVPALGRGGGSSVCRKWVNRFVAAFTGAPVSRRLFSIDTVRRLSDAPKGSGCQTLSCASVPSSAMGMPAIPRSLGSCNGTWRFEQGLAQSTGSAGIRCVYYYSLQNNLVSMDQDGANCGPPGLVSWETFFLKDAWRAFHISMLANGPVGSLGASRPLCLR